ncbi:MAG: FAD-dependent oxidoreductase [Bacteroidota bacterium]|nr:FAD-dependent oxidoreductase [Bacteroidota bacterium]
MLLLIKEHPKSTSKFLEEDANLNNMPSKGGEGKSVVVIGGGISGLSSAKYLIDAGFDVTLLEKRNIVGGNNDPYMKNGKHYATTVIITLPAQQPHYLELCREYGISQTPHKFDKLEGAIVMQDKILITRMGSGFITFLKLIYKQCSFKEIIDGIRILFLFYRQFKLRPESKKSVKDVLGSKLINSPVFTHVFMPWIGINTWCRFEDVDIQPAHIFGAFIFEYALPIKMRYKNYLKNEDRWCVLDGRLIHKLEKILLKEEKYKQYLDTTVQNIKRKKDGKLIVSAHTKEWLTDYVIVATQPFQALPLIKNLGPKELIDELEKWDKMDCYVILHADISNIKNMPWIHQTYKNKVTGNFYITNTIKPIMAEENLEYVITFVYNQENYTDFISNNIDNSKIVKVYEPKLPVFTLENSVNRNDIWKKIDDKCTDIYWTQACRSGLQYHNNGILSAKRVIRSLVKKIN